MGKEIAVLHPRVTEFAGGKLVQVTMDTASTVVSMNIGVGALLDPGGVSGLAHALEHGTLAGNFAEVMKFRRGLDKGAKTWFAGTDWWLTEYLAQDGAGSAPGLMGILLRMAGDPTFDEAQIRHDLLIVRSEKNGEPDKPWEYLGDIFEYMWFAPVLGTDGIRGRMESIEHMEVADLRRHHRRHYSSDNLTMVVAGDTRKSKKTFEKLVERWRRGNRQEIQSLSRGDERRAVKDMSYADTYLMMGVPALPLGDPRMPILECIEIILGGMGTKMSSSILSKTNRESGVGAYRPDSAAVSEFERPRLVEKLAGYLDGILS